MKILAILMVILCLVVVVGLCWVSFKMLRETQKQVQLEHEEKIRKNSSEQ